MGLRIARFGNDEVMGRIKASFSSYSLTRSSPSIPSGSGTSPHTRSWDRRVPARRSSPGGACLSACWRRIPKTNPRTNSCGLRPSACCIWGRRVFPCHSPLASVWVFLAWSDYKTPVSPIASPTILESGRKLPETESGNHRDGSVNCRFSELTENGKSDTDKSLFPVPTASSSNIRPPAMPARRVSRRRGCSETRKGEIQKSRRVRPRAGGFSRAGW